MPTVHCMHTSAGVQTFPCHACKHAITQPHGLEPESCPNHLQLLGGSSADLFMVYVECLCEECARKLGPKRFLWSEEDLEGPGADDFRPRVQVPAHGLPVFCLDGCLGPKGGCVAFAACALPA